MGVFLAWAVSRGDILDLTKCRLVHMSAYQNKTGSGKLRIRVVDRVRDSALARPGEFLFLQISG